MIPPLKCCISHILQSAQYTPPTTLLPLLCTNAVQNEIISSQLLNLLAWAATSFSFLFEDHNITQYLCHLILNLSSTINPKFHLHDVWPSLSKYIWKVWLNNLLINISIFKIQAAYKYSSQQATCKLPALTLTFYNNHRKPQRAFSWSFLYAKLLSKASSTTASSPMYDY